MWQEDSEDSLQSEIKLKFVCNNLQFLFKI